MCRPHPNVRVVSCSGSMLLVTAEPLSSKDQASVLSGSKCMLTLLTALHLLSRTVSYENFLGKPLCLSSVNGVPGLQGAAFYNIGWSCANARSRRRFPMYFLAQFLGGFVASGVVYWNYVDSIDAFEGYGKRTVPPAPTATAGMHYLVRHVRTRCTDHVTVKVYFAHTRKHK